MTREELALAACEGVPDDMLRGVKLLALLEKSQALLSSSDALKAQAAECMRMLEVVTRELLACTEMYRRDVVQVPLDASPVERCEARIADALQRLHDDMPRLRDVWLSEDGRVKGMEVG